MDKEKRNRTKKYRISVLVCILLLLLYRVPQSITLSSHTWCLASDMVLIGEVEPPFVDEEVVEQVLLRLPVTFEGFYQEQMSIWSSWVLSPSNTNTLRVFYHPIGWEVDTSPLDNNDWIDGFIENAMYLFEQIEELEEVSFSFFFTPLGEVLKFDGFDFRFTTSRLGVAEGEMLIERSDQYNEFELE